jgi:hypothetical protein
LRKVFWADPARSVAIEPSKWIVAAAVVGRSANSHLQEHELEVSVVVVDQGMGISREDQKKLFVPFAQIRPHELQSGSGSGLGLTLAKEIVLMHGGKLLMDSEVGKGSSFGFRIRFAISSDDSVNVSRISASYHDGGSCMQGNAGPYYIVSENIIDSNSMKGECTSSVFLPDGMTRGSEIATLPATERGFGTARLVRHLRGRGRGRGESDSGRDRDRDRLSVELMGGDQYDSAERGESKNTTDTGNVIGVGNIGRVGKGSEGRQGGNRPQNK